MDSSLLMILMIILRGPFFILFCYTRFVTNIGETMFRIVLNKRDVFG